MDEYIKRSDVVNELIKKLETSINSWGRDCNSNAPTMVRAYQDVLHRVKHISTADVVEVVRCKDCKHLTNDGFCWENIHAVVGYKIPNPDDFCSFGERKEGDDK